MAAKQAHPGRQLGVFAIGMLLLFGLVALAGTWTPALGLDLQGGQRITLRAEDDDVSSSQLEEARAIINERVNASGFSEAEVNTQGEQNVVVEIPGDSNQDLVELVQRQAQLRFRLVACTKDPSGGVSGPCSGATTPTPSLPGVTANRAAPGGLMKADKHRDKKGDKGEATETPSPTATTSPTPTEAPATPSGDVTAALAWTASPAPEWVSQFTQASCPMTTPPTDDPNKPLLTCDENNVLFLLSAAVVEGTELDEADAVQPQSGIGWEVTLELKEKGTEQFAQVSKALVNTDDLFAMVLDGQVISAPTMDAEITDGRASISNPGGMPESEAKKLATSLKFGALPVAFEDDPLNETVGPSLAGTQLEAGILAGVVGLMLVMVYCLLYYRGLGTVVIASLIVAGLMVYGLVLLLSNAGFTLSLPGIAGLIVAVGITADSFIVFFERIRDEMRDGKSMRVAVESGWARARNTCLAADAVSFSAAVVLYIFAIDDVRGFAFTLGLTVLVDLAVFFWFTKPLVSWLGHFPFFNQGHKLSGLSAGTLGIDRIAGVRAGGTA